MNSSRTNTTPLAAGAPSMTAPQLPPRLFIPMGSVRGEAPDAHPASLRDLRHIRYGTILFGIPLAVLLSSPEDALRRKIPDYDDQTILQILFMHIHIKINVSVVVSSLSTHVQPPLGFLVAGIRAYELHVQDIPVRARRRWRELQGRAREGGRKSGQKIPRGELAISTFLATAPLIPDS